jgi:hypothetical protein
MLVNVADFQFNASEYLVQESVAGIGAIERIDQFLASRNINSVVKPRIVAEMTGESQRDVDAVLAAYANHRVLKPQEMVECEQCQTMAPLDEVQEATNAGDDYPCPGSCDRDLASRGLEPQLVYQLINTPT